SGNRHAPVRADLYDALARDHDRGRRAHPEPLWLEDPGVGDDHRTLGLTREGIRQRPLVIPGATGLHGGERLRGVFPALADRHRPLRPHGEEFAVLVEPYRRRREAEARDLVMDHGAWLALRWDRERLHALDPGLALREEGQLPFGRLQQSPCEPAELDGRPVEADVERRAGEGPASLLGRAVPIRLPLLNRESLSNGILQ